MNALSLLWGGAGLWVRLAIYAAIAAAVVAAYAAFVHKQRDIGRAEVQLKWDAAVSQQRAADLAQSSLNAQETQRRLAAQQETQRAQDKLLAQARADAGRNAADADRLRTQSTAAAQQWSATLGHSPTVGQCQAAGDAIGVFADVLGRADRRAGILADIADTARIAGLKCEADYDSLTPGPQAAQAVKH